MEVTGLLKVKYDTVKVSEKFQKRDFVLTTDATTQYPQQVIMQLSQDKCQILDLFNAGEEIKVSINLRGREWNGPQGIKYFNTLEAWKVEKLGSANVTTAPVAPIETASPIATAVSNNNDDLPF